METSKASRSFSYSIFSFVKDELKGTAIPVGVALWGAESEFVRVRLAKQEDRVKGLDSLAYFHIEGVRQELEMWRGEKKLPYASNELSPHSDEWWSHVSRLFVHQVKVSQPRTIDCQRPDEEVESLYEAIVGPRLPQRERAKRIDSALSKSLGILARELDRGTVVGYRGRGVNVHLSKSSQDEVLIVDGINLASVDAEFETDALVSRLLRIKAGNDTETVQRKVKACIGYLTSPQGLNGEATLVQWIEEKCQAKTFDLVRDQERFYSAVHSELGAVQSQVRLTDVPAPH
jgi:hypothetical protein